MPRSDWRVLLAIVLGLGALASSYGYYKVEEATRPKYAQDNYQPARDASLAKAAPGQTQTPKYDPHCQQPQNATDGDLCAQWSAVKAVEESNRLVRVGVLLSFLLGAIGVVVTGVGTVLVYRSLKQGEEGLTAARDANDAAKDNADRDHRTTVEQATPRIIVTLGNFKREAMWLNFDIVASNVGGSGCVVTGTFHNWGTTEDKAWLMTGVNQAVPLVAGATEKLDPMRVMDETLLQTPILYVNISYEGPFIGGGERIKRVAFQVFRDISYPHMTHYNHVHEDMVQRAFARAAAEAKRLNGLSNEQPDDPQK